MRIGVPDPRPPVRDTRRLTYLLRAPGAQATPRNLAKFYKSNKMNIELGAVTLNRRRSLCGHLSLWSVLPLQLSLRPRLLHDPFSYQKCHAREFLLSSSDRRLTSRLFDIQVGILSFEAGHPSE